ncbi:hypothetical protein DMENIID0001_048850 [Sergentomyia squamirostris]
MAPGANTNNNGGGQGNPKRQTGTVPKTKARKNSSLPQEIVVPTRRDLQQHLNDLVNNLQQQPEDVSLIRSRNRRTPGEGGCFDLENISLQENSRFIPVRPILRRNLLHDDLSDQHPLSSGHNLANTAIGVVIPTTPNTVHDTPVRSTADVLGNYQNTVHRIPEGNPHIPTNLPPSRQVAIRGNIEERLSQIQDYIQITSGLINSIRSDKINGPRPQSVASIHSNTPDTPSIDDLQQRLGSSGRNMQNIKEQQQQLMRLQQAAKQQLQEMEQIRVQHPISQTLNQEAPPNYDSVDAVRDDVQSLMTRMQALTNFIHGQNDVASLMGDDAAVAMAEQAMLQKKLQELKDRKSQMEKLVSELQNMNVEADRAFADTDQNHVNGTEPTRIVPMSLERIVPIELLSSPAVSQASAPACLQPSTTLTSDIESETDNAELDGMDEAEATNAIGDKIAEINAMKDQLTRLKDMMETVKLIEMKTGMEGNEEMLEEQATGVSEHFNNLSGSQQTPAKVTNSDFERPQRDENVISERVQALHAMTADLRAQALSLVSERERLKTIKDEMERRRDEMLEKTSNQSGSTIREVSPGPREREHQLLKEEYESKKKEYEKIMEKLESERQRQTSWNPSAPSVAPAAQQQPPRTNSVRPCGACSKQISTESTDSTIPIDAASLKSGSTKSLQQIGMERSGASGASASSAWRKTSRDNVEMSPGNATPHPLSMQTNNFSPCNSFYAPANQNFCNLDHQSPQCHHHHLTNESSFYGNVITGGRGDSLLLQQFIQTQQMLINSVSQCNQLLWSQQRELNNLNNAVLLLQERLLKQDTLENSISNSMRAESVPPNVATTSGNQISSFLHRAQSEQPINAAPFYGGGQNQFPPPLSPVRIYPNYQNQVLRNQGVNPIGGNNNSMNNRVARVAGNVQQSPSNGYYQNGANDQQSAGGLFANLNPFSNANNVNQLPPTATSNQGQQQPVLLNNNPNSLLNAQTTATPIFIHHNNNTSGGNNANLQHHHQNATTVANTAFATHVPPPPALNNQVAPGNRANNYWDNFRSYSRQNLLSGNSCKSNEDSCSSSSSNFPFNTDQRAPNFRHQANLPVFENKFDHHRFRNEVNQANGGVLEAAMEQQHEIHLIPDSAEGMTSSDVLGFHTNPINLGVSEFSAKSKTQAKGNGNKKRSRRMMDRNILATNPDSVASDDRNLASSATSGRNTKSTSKFFEELKENVYMEVSALIAANELRPYFLIQLFRDLQLMSSDPMRQQTLQSIQDLYNRYVESTIHEEASAYGSTNPINADNEDNAMQQHQNAGQEHYDFQSSSQSTPARSADNSVQPDYDMLRIVAQEVSEFLQTVEVVNEAALQRIATIVLTHLNNSINEKLTLSKYYINQEDFMNHLTTFNRAGDKEELLGNIENYLTSLIIPSAAATHGVDADDDVGECVEGAVGGDLSSHPIEMEGYLQIVTPQQRQSDDDLVDVSAAFTSIPCNGDLAEADQICSSESLYEEDVQTSNPQIQQQCGDARREDEGVWISDEEVEILSTNGNSSSTNGTEGKH